MAVRRAFVSGAGRRFVSVDYGQIEMRVFAHCSQDPQLLQLFRQRDASDIYAVIAAYLHGEQPAAVTKPQRDQAKVITLGLCYGMGVESMAAKLGIAPKSALELRTQILRVGDGGPLLRRNTAASSGS